LGALPRLIRKRVYFPIFPRFVTEIEMTVPAL
jgi:hypothetical protein